MAKKEISIVLRAKNAMAAGLSKAGKSLKAFGGSAMRIGGMFAKAFLGAAAAVAGLAAKAVAAYAIQETAERSLIAAMNAHGEAGEALIPSLKRIAAAIQDETGAADESTLAGMAKMRMLGVQTSKLGEAAKGVLALKVVGLQEEAAQKAVAMAMQGSYDMLNRYLPALRMTNDETEKAAIVNEFFAKGYEQQEGLLDTVGGQWNVLKGRVGDVWEEIGKAISQNNGLMISLKRAGEAVKEFGVKVTSWVEGGGIVRLIAGVKLFYVDVKRKFQLIGNSSAVTWAAIGDGGETAIRYITNIVKIWAEALVAEFKYVKDYVVAVWKKIKGGKFEPPDIKPYLDVVKKMGKALAGSSGIVSKRTEAALADRLKIEENYAAEVVKISEEQAGAQIALEDKVAAAKKLDADASTAMALAASKAEAVAAEEAALAEEAAWKKAQEAKTKVAQKEADKQKKLKIKLLKDELTEIKKQQGEIEGLAKSRVQAVIDEARAAKDEAKSRDKDAAKARRLTEKQARGVKISRKDKEFLDAFNKIEAAKGKAANLEAAGKAAEGKLVAAEKKALKVQEDTRDDIHVIRQQNEKLLTYSGN